MSLLAAALLAWAGWVTSAWLPSQAWAASQVPAVAVLLALLLGDGDWRWRLHLPQRAARPGGPAPTEEPLAPVVDLDAERERRRAA